MDALDAFLDSSPQQVGQDALDAFLDSPDVPPGTGEDVIRSGASGLARAIPYAIDVPAAALASGLDWATGSPNSFGQNFNANMGQGLNAATSKVLGAEYEPKTEAGKLTKGAGMVVGSLPLGGVGAITRGMVGRAAASGAAGTLGSQVGGGIGQAVGGDTGEVIGSIAGGLGGGIAGFKSPEIGAKTAAGVGRIVVPEADAALAPLAQRAQEFGIPLSLDQIAPSRVRTNAQKASSNLPFSGVDKFQKEQVRAFNKAVASTLGETADNLGPDTIKPFLERSSKGFEDILKGKSIKVTPQSLATIETIAQNADDYLTRDLAEVVRKNVDKLKKDMLPDGTIPGDKLATFRSQMVKGLPKAPGGAKEYLGDLMDEVDTLSQASMSPQEAQQLRDLRHQWRNFRTVEPLLEKATDGNISPALLQQRVAASPYIKASRASVGEDDLVDLARIGKQFLRVNEGSDTFGKSVLGGSAAGLATTFANNPAGAITAGVVGGGLLSANRGFQKFVNQSPALVKRSIAKAKPQAPNPKGAIRRRPNP